jgi:hypothetical protein
VTFTVGRTTVLAALLVLASVPGPDARAQQPSRGYVLEVELASLHVVADTVTGLSLLMQPKAGSRVREREGPVWLRLQPDSALEWINSAVAAIRTPLPGDQSEGIQWSRTLRPLRDSGAVALGRSRKRGRLERTHWLAIADSASGWRFELTASEADSLLRLLLIGGSQSRTDTSSAAPLDESRVDRPARIVDQPAAKRRQPGQAAVQYVVGSDGKVEPESFRVLLASDPGLIGETRTLVLATRFDAAERQGARVRQVLRQVIQWERR